MVHCVKCGAENPDDAEFCNKCGSGLYGGESKHHKRKEDECFGLPRGGAIFGLFIGAIIILWGISEVLNIDIPLWGFVVIIFGVLVFVGGIYSLTRDRRS
ncbi:MAG: zinc-ribbon domain-containing protein [Candidatus Hodarchaeota archaeon]